MVPRPGLDLQPPYRPASHQNSAATAQRRTAATVTTWRRASAAMTGA